MAAVRRGDLEPGSRVVLVVTGAQPHERVGDAVTTIDPNVHDVLAALGLAS
jgi:predicted nucleotidyltransferase